MAPAYEADDRHIETIKVKTRDFRKLKIADPDERS
jgi:hypothetical protein